MKRKDQVFTLTMNMMDMFVVEVEERTHLLDLVLVVV